MDNPINLTAPMISESPEDTEKIGRELARLISSDASLPRVIAFRGDLGVGKTAFTKGFTSYISPLARVKSPTFSLVNEYKNKETGLSVFHFDMYRIENEDDLYSIGFYEYLDGKNFVLIEWSENISEFDGLPEKVIFVEICKCTEEFPDRRVITLTTRE